MQFLIPGLIIMVVAQESFDNPSVSIVNSKQIGSFDDFLIANAIFRYSPNGMNKKTIAGLDIGNIFANNRIGSSDSFESGKSYALSLIRSAIF